MKGFTLMELLIAIGISLVLIGVIYAFYEAEVKNFQLNQRQMEAIDRLWLNMDKVKQEIREGNQFEDNINFTLPSGSDTPLIVDMGNETIAFFSSNDNLYRALSGDTTAQTVGVNVSMSPATAASGLARITLSTTWTYRNITRTESISSQVVLRNWGRN